MSRRLPLVVVASLSLLGGLAHPAGSSAADAADELAAIGIGGPAPLFTDDLATGTTPAGAWRTSAWRLDFATTQVSVDLELALEPHPHGLRPGPVVVFWTVAVEQVDREFRERRVFAVDLPADRVLQTCPVAGEPCVLSTTLDADAEPLLAAVGGRVGVERTWLAFTVVRTFEHGELRQIVQPGAPEPGPVSSLGRSRPATGSLVPVGLRPRGDDEPGLVDLSPRDEPFVGLMDYAPIVDRAVVDGGANAQGPDPWVPVSVSLSASKDTSCEGYRLTLVSELGDRTISHQILDPNPIELRARVARGGDWSLAWDYLPEAPPPLGEPFAALDDAYAITGSVRCDGPDPAAEIIVQRVGPERARPIDLAAVGAVAGALALGLVVVGSVAVLLRGRR